ncbi:glycosyltransferase family 4 protein [Bacillus coahuilensis]|uniref:glycosyltransferase family 4 protein n=1 Tax=Bacillus coahuilensis TaxID=408580 RepID=UPI000314611F|nr:glycosyltransferase family 4 protein [Bacillus coahuilensis]
MKQYRLLFLSWRDIRSPLKGGAETFTHELMKGLVKKGHQVTHFSPQYSGTLSVEVIDGIEYRRKGNMFTVLYHSANFYFRNHQIIHYVVDQCNTHRFFSFLWVKRSKRVFFIHQLTREIWFYHAKFPFHYLGFVLEPLLLWLNRNDRCITVSESTKHDLLKIGFRDHNVTILPEGLDIPPLKQEDFYQKEETPTFLYIGRMAKYKGIHDALVAYREFNKEYPKSKFWVIGAFNQEYFSKTIEQELIKSSLSYAITDGRPDNKVDVSFMGFVSSKKRSST